MKLAEIFETAYLQEYARVFFFSQPDEATTHERDRLWQLFHLWWSYHESRMSGIRHAHETV